MKLRCAACHRGLLKPAYTHPSGYVLGPKCAMVAGKVKPKRRECKKATAKAADPDQFDMFVILERQYLVELAAAPIAADDEDDPLAVVPIIHRLISAATAAPIAPRGPVSVFDMWRAPITTAKRKPQEAVKVMTRVEVVDGAVRCVRILPQETQEWQIKEAARRARQTPPKPTKSAKTMSSKMATMLGMEPVAERYAARVSLALQKQVTPSKREQERAEREQRQRPARARRAKD
ncbi:MAG: hypothetical protein Q7T78_17095 [Rhodoferax sp.]|nr:hypothetical protein [Rhodoferax sp.]